MMTATTTRRPISTIPTPYQAGGVAVTLHQPRPGIYHLACWINADRLHDWCRSYSDEATARAEARRAARAFARHGSPERIAARLGLIRDELYIGVTPTRRDQLNAEIRELESVNARAGRHHHDAAHTIATAWTYTALAA